MYRWKIKEYLHFGVLLTVQALALVSESTLRFALPLYLLNVSGSPSLYGVATAVAFVPSVLLMPAAGVVADRVDMRRILVIAGSVLVLCSACYLFLFRAHLLVMTILFLVTLYAVHALYIPMFQAQILACEPGEHGEQYHRACVGRRFNGMDGHCTACVFWNGLPRCGGDACIRMSFPKKISCGSVRCGHR